MKPNSFKSPKLTRATDAGGFTLLELLVVVGVIAVLIVLELPALAAGKSQSKIAVCAGHIRQLTLCCQIYVNENNNKLPVLANAQGQALGSWAWDLPEFAAQLMLKSGVTETTFYCPGTAPRFTDTQNWAGPNPSGMKYGANSTLWGFGQDGPTANPSTDFHIIGYSMAFSGPASKLAVTNQNTTIQPEAIRNFPSSGKTTTYRASERVLVADAILSIGNWLPGYVHPENNYTSIPGGFQWNGAPYPHVSPHLNGNVPAGGNLGFKDGHVEWREFDLMTPRTSSGAVFWW